MAAKLLTNREAELFRVAIYWRGLYEASDPPSGLAPSREDIAAEIADDLSFVIDEDDVAEAAETASGQ